MPETIVYRVAEVTELKRFVNLALAYELHTRNKQESLLYTKLVTAACTRRDALFKARARFMIGLAFSNDVPIGVALISGPILQVYVKPLYRRLGIGSGLISELNRKYDIKDRVITLRGQKGSSAFYKKNGLCVEKCLEER